MDRTNSSVDQDSGFDFEALRGSFSERIKQVRGKKSQGEFAEFVGKKQQVISRWEQGTTWPDAESLITISRITGKSIDWLLTGKEETQIPPPELHIQETPTLKAFSENHHFSKENYIPIRLLKDDIAAGAPSEIREWDVEGWALIYASKEWMPHDPENYTCCHVQGYSMWPILAPGDIVAIDHAERDVEDLKDKMVVFRNNGGATVKWLRVFTESGIVIGEPENKDERGSTIILKYDEAHAAIVGKVAWWWAKR